MVIFGVGVNLSIENSYILGTISNYIVFLNDKEMGKRNIAIRLNIN